MTSIELTAPAKVNLYLKVLNKRKDSYHNILTIFERISLADRIKITKIPEGIEVISDTFITKDPGDNLVYKAAEAMLGAGARNRGVRIELSKRIPIAAGLGGGSSDAASVISGINALLSLNMNKADMMKIAAGIGSDVPFFMLGTPYAVGRSRGEELTVIKMKRKLWHLVVNPGWGISAKEAYEAFDRMHELSSSHSPKDLTTPAGNDKIHLHFADSVDFASFESMIHNDLQATVSVKKRVVGRIIGRLASILGRKVTMSGSGPSVFCLYRTGKEAMAARARLLDEVPERERKGWTAFVAGTM